MGVAEGEKGGTKHQIDDSEGMCSSESYESSSCLGRFCNPRKNGALRDVLRGLLVLIVLAIIVTVIFLVCYFLITDIEKKESEVVNDLVSEFSNAAGRGGGVGGRGQPPPQHEFDIVDIGYLPEPDQGSYLPNEQDSYGTGAFGKKSASLEERPRETLLVPPVAVEGAGFVPIGYHAVNTHPDQSLSEPSSTVFENYDIIEPASGGNECEPLRLAQCSDSMPWVLTAFPNMMNNTNANELRASLIYLRSILIETDCSPKSKEFTCALLEPPCGPDGTPLPPCRDFCEDVVSMCSTEVFASTHPQSRAFDCTRYPLSENPNVCVKLNERPSEIPVAEPEPKVTETILEEDTSSPNVEETSVDPAEGSAIGEEFAATVEGSAVDVNTPADYEYEDEVLICDHTMFLCDDGSDCLTTESVCDGIRHCLDNSDEFNCSRPESITSSFPEETPSTTHSEIITDPPTTTTTTTTTTIATTTIPISTRKPSLSEMLSGSAIVATTTGSPRRKVSFLDLPDSSPHAESKPGKSLADILGATKGATADTQPDEAQASAPEPSFLLPPRQRAVPFEGHAGFLPTPQRSLSDILSSVLPTNR